MFIRKTKTSASAKGNHYSYRLVETYRVASKVKQKTLLNLGAHFDLEREYWPDLCQCIQNRLSNQLDLAENQFSSTVLCWAERLLVRLRPAENTSSTQRWVESVDLAQQRDENCRTVGLERLALHAMEQLDLPNCLSQLPIKPSYVRLALGLIGARMIAPDSERATYHWLQQTSALPELLNFTASDLQLDRLYRVGDTLWKHKDSIETHLRHKTQQLFGGDGAIILYDLTNTWFTTTKKNSEQVKFGRGKQRGTKAPITTLGLSLSETGFPLHSEILPGNVSEPSTLQDAIARLEKQTIRTNQARPLVIMDAGISTEANRTWLVEQGYDYLTIDRTQQAVPARPEEALIKSSQSGEVRVWRIAQEEDNVHLIVHSPSREAKENAMRAQKQQHFEAELDYLEPAQKRKIQIKTTT